MPLTLLLDLDDTLLENPIQAFEKAYFDLLGSTLEPVIPARQLLPVLRSATLSMLEKTAPAGSLQEVFAANFFPHLPVPEDTLTRHFDQFYLNVFPQLQRLTRPRTQAVQLVQYALAHQWKVVIATNPLFPRTAIEQRLKWAELDPGTYPFALITSYETAHFAKPHVAYYAEILARLGWPAEPAIMVGNSLPDDIEPAARLGLATYYLTATPGLFPLPGDPARHRSGSLEDLIPFLDELAAQSSSTQLTPATASPVLAADAAAVQTILGQANPAHLNLRPDPSEWSITEILCHLRDVECEVNLPRIQRVLSEDNPFLPGIISDDWANERRYQAQNVFAASDQWIHSRSQLISRLSSLNQTEWNKPARHAIFGPTDLIEMVNFMFQHDRDHIQQIITNLNLGWQARGGQ